MRAQQKQPQPSEDDIRELLELAQIPYTHAARAAAQFALAEAVANYEEENVGHRWPSRKMWLDVETAAQRLLEAMHGLNDFYGPGDIGWWWEGTTKAKKRAAMMAAEAEGLFPGYLDPSEAKAYGLNPTTKGMAEAMDLLRDMQAPPRSRPGCGRVGGIHTGAGTTLSYSAQHCFSPDTRQRLASAKPLPGPLASLRKSSSRPRLAPRSPAAHWTRKFGKWADATRTRSTRRTGTQTNFTSRRVADPQDLIP
jgi:hypothetical protein